MEISVKHIGSLLGRVFLLASKHSTENWNGNIPSDNDQTDYESLSNFLSYEEGDLTLMQKSSDYYYHVYFSMSSKVEIFEIESGFIIIDGLYFNMSWDYNKPLSIITKSKINLEFEVTCEIIFIYDAALQGKSVLSDKENKREWQDQLSIKLSNGKYSVLRVEIGIFVEGEDEVLKGIMIAR